MIWKRHAMRAYLRFMRPGDWLVIGTGVAACAALSPYLWNNPAPYKAVVRAGGKVFAEVGLNMRRTLEVPGPLGTTVVEVVPGRARVAADPGPRQYCVRQGWLTRANAVAICAPNQVSLSLEGRAGGYDSLNY
jgi:hypothetical protein